MNREADTGALITIIDLLFYCFILFFLCNDDYIFPGAKRKGNVVRFMTLNLSVAKTES